MKKIEEKTFAVKYFDIALKLATEINQETDNSKDVGKILEITKQILQINKG
jgi:hypothetical protein